MFRGKSGFVTSFAQSPRPTQITGLLLTICIVGGIVFCAASSEKMVDMWFTTGFAYYKIL